VSICWIGKGKERHNIFSQLEGVGFFHYYVQRTVKSGCSNHKTKQQKCWGKHDKSVLGSQ